MRTPEGLRAHLTEELVPLWASHGVDRERGGFWWRLDRGCVPVLDPYKRLRVQTRQIYVFSRAGESALAGLGLEYLRERFWDPDHGGFYNTVSHDGTPLDRSKDLYDHAFALLALGAYAAIEPDSDALELARRTRSLLEEHLGDRTHGGYLEGADERWAPREGARRQNPHMHLLEAFLLLASVDGDPEWVDGAIAMVELCETHFFDSQAGVLREYFGPDWSPRDDAEGRTVEPGHHFEWVSLLAQFELLTGRVSQLPDRLFRFASDAGCDPEYGGVYDAVDVDGRVTAATKRLWPQTEYVRSLAVRGETEALGDVLDAFFARYFDPGTRGWRERATREGVPSEEPMSATSVYHVWNALDAAAEFLSSK